MASGPAVSNFKGPLTEAEEDQASLEPGGIQQCEELDMGELRG